VSEADGPIAAIADIPSDRVAVLFNKSRWRLPLLISAFYIPHTKGRYPRFGSISLTLPLTSCVWNFPAIAYTSGWPADPHRAVQALKVLFALRDRAHRRGMHLPVKAGQTHKMNSVRWCPCYWPHRRCVNHAGAFRAPLYTKGADS